MLEQLKYRNHLGETFEFGKDGIFVNYNDLRDYEWTVAKKNNRITDLSYTIVKRKLPIIIYCKTEAAGVAAKNRLFEIVEKDVLAMQHGRIILGDYYLRCYVVKSQKKNYLSTKRYLEVTLTLTTDFPYWIKETSSNFLRNDLQHEKSKWLEYDYDFPHDYLNDVRSDVLSNKNFVASNFRLMINGPCENPIIHISDHAYQVKCTVEAGEYLTVDSVAKTITKTGVDGTITNLFNRRNKESYIFEKIPAGENSISWNGTFSFEIILHEERSEPKWI